MTELLPKPKRENWPDNYYGDVAFYIAQRDYYKRLAELAIMHLQRLQRCIDEHSAVPAQIDLSRIKQSEQS